jgi:hypothetical protein
MPEPTITPSRVALQPAKPARPQRSVLLDRAIDFAKTFAWVAPFTILIWIYAEREQITQQGVPFPIEVRAADGSRIVTLKDPSDHNIIVNLTGPRTTLDRVRDFQIGGPNGAPLQIYLEDARKLPKGEYTFSAARYIANNPIFTRMGISVKDINPSVLRVVIDDLETRELTVKAPANIPNLQDVSFIPATVKVRAPSRVFEEADPSRLFVEADLLKQDILKQPGHHDVQGIAITPAFKGEQINLDPRTIAASIEIKKIEAEWTLESVPVWPFAPPKLSDRYKVVYKSSTIPNVHVVGPPDKIEALKNGDYRVVAQLEITDEDEQSPTKDRRKRLRFTNLPPGVAVTNDPEQYTITYSLVDRANE